MYFTKGLILGMIAGGMLYCYKGDEIKNIANIGMKRGKRLWKKYKYMMR